MRQGRSVTLCPELRTFTDAILNDVSVAAAADALAEWNALVRAECAGRKSQLRCGGDMP